MSVGTTALTCYQSEDVVWTFTLTDANVTDITGWALALVIKTTAAALDPPLLGPFTCSIIGGPPTLVYRASFRVVVAPGTYVVSVRRTDAGFSWQTHHGSLTVVDSASID